MMEIVGTLSGVVVGAAVTAAVQHWREKQERKRIGYGMKKLFTIEVTRIKEWIEVKKTQPYTNAWDLPMTTRVYDQYAARIFDVFNSSTADAVASFYVAVTEFVAARKNMIGDHPFKGIGDVDERIRSTYRERGDYALESAKRALAVLQS